MNKITNNISLNFIAKFNVLMALIILISCEKTPPARFSYEQNPKLSWGYALYYSDYYSNYGINNSVVSLNLFSEGLSITENGELKGSGQHLVIEDVFSLPTDTLLQSGNYVAGEQGAAMTFFKGKYFTDNKTKMATGTYLRYIEAEASRTKTVILPKCNFSLRIKNDSIVQIKLKGETENTDSITCIFEGILPYYDLSTTQKKSNELLLNKF